MESDLELAVMDLVVDSGSARSYAMEAIAYAKDGKFEQAAEALDHADKEILKAHHTQTNLIRREAGGDKIGFSLIIVHSQDHLMNAMVVRDLAREFVELYKELK